MYKRQVHESRIRENIDVFDFELSEQDLSEIETMDDGVRVGAHPDELNIGAPEKALRARAWLTSPGTPQPRTGPEGLTEDDRPVTVEQDPVLAVPAHGPGQCERLGVLPDRGESRRVEGVVDADDFLLDDGALVQVGGDVVGGGAHLLDAPIECLVVGLGALETGQEGCLLYTSPSPRD